MLDTKAKIYSRVCDVLYNYEQGYNRTVYDSVNDMYEILSIIQQRWHDIQKPDISDEKLDFPRGLW